MTMRATMMDFPLTIRMLWEHAANNHGEREIVSRDYGSLHRYTIRDFAPRVGRLANALKRLGVKQGDRVASFAWNSHRHLELYYAVPSIGAVLHTVNIRLFPDQVAYVLNHADDRVVFFDSSLTQAIEKAAAADPKARRTYASMGGTMTTALKPAYDYETLLAAESSEFAWPALDERQPALICYTSATTGDPKGVVYSHRSTVLHAFASGQPDVFNLSGRDVVFPIVPMFHVNAWGLPFVCLMAGAKLVFGADALDPASIIDLMNRERVTFSGGVPTIWIAVREELLRTGGRLETLQRMIVGGMAVPESLMRWYDERGITIIHAFGMTETSPIATVSRVKAALADEPAERHLTARLKQGTFVAGIEWRVMDAEGKPVPRDGKTSGELQYRGPWVTGGYHDSEAASKAAMTEDGWFRSGDIVTVDELAYVQVVDRAKDLVKSGGEWISSVDVENTLMGHPAVKEATVIGVPHEKWLERPIAVVVLRDGAAATEAEVRDWLTERLAKWWVPDRVVFVDAIPRTGVGKFLKRELRERYRDLLTGARAPALHK
jgi:fatty-acyl-CoA synthase